MSRKPRPTWAVFSGDSASSFAEREVSHLMGVICVLGVDGGGFGKAMRVMQASGSRKMKLKHPGWSKESSDLQTVTMLLLVAFTFFRSLSIAPHGAHTKQCTQQGNSSSMTRTMSFLFFAALPSPSSPAPATAIPEVFRFEELIPNGLRSRRIPINPLGTVR